MAEEEVAAAPAAASPVPSDCKRKFEDLHSEPTEQQSLESNTNTGEPDAAVTDEGENKRPRLDDENRDDLGNLFILQFQHSRCKIFVISPFLIFLNHISL